MNERYEMRFTGSGGQGIILASVILAEAAVIDGYNAVQSQAYGPEARGGQCKAEAILSRDEIWFTKVMSPAFLLCMTQASLDKYGPDIADGAIVMIDASLTVPDYLDPARVLSVPILQTAKDVVGKIMTANIVAVGAVNAVLGLFSEDALRQSVCRHIPAGTEELNLRALEEGARLISPAQKEAYRHEL